MKYIIQARETGESIDECATREIAESTIMEYEEEDRNEGTYTPDFYEVKEVMERDDCIRAAGPLYDGGWRASDKAVLAVEYDLEGQALDWVCEELERLADEDYEVEITESGPHGFAEVRWEDGGVQVIALNEGDEEKILNGADPVKEGWEDGAGLLVCHDNASYGYGIFEEDADGKDITDNSGASSLEEALDKAERMCSNSRTAKAMVFRSADPNDILAVAVAPCDDAWEIEREYYETLRASMFGQDSPGSWKDQLDDVEGFIDWGMDILAQEDAEKFIISDRPVVFNPAIHEIPVYSTKAVRRALESVFDEEVESWRKEASDDE